MRFAISRRDEMTIGKMRRQEKGTTPSGSHVILTHCLCYKRVNPSGSVFCIYLNFCNDTLIGSEFNLSKQYLPFGDFQSVYREVICYCSDDVENNTGRVP